MSIEKQIQDLKDAIQVKTNEKNATDEEIEQLSNRIHDLTITGTQQSINDKHIIKAYFKNHFEFKEKHTVTKMTTIYPLVRKESKNSKMNFLSYK